MSLSLSLCSVIIRLCEARWFRGSVFFYVHLPHPEFPWDWLYVAVIIAIMFIIIHMRIEVRSHTRVGISME